MKSSVNAAYIVGLYLFACEITEYFLVRRHDREVFPPKIGFRLLRWFAIATCSAGILSSDKSLNWTLIFFLSFLVVWLRWPRTVLVDSAGVSSCSLFGLFRQAIPWVDVNQVSSDWQEAHFRFWTFTGYGVTVISRYGSRIEHGFVNQGQARFLNALRRFVPREAFDAGLYEWHPDAPIATS